MNSLDWKVGDIRIFQVFETEIGKIVQQIIKDATPPNIKSIPWLQPHFADSKGNLKASVQGFLIKSHDQNILIDTGIGNNKLRQVVPEWGNLHTEFLKNLEAIGLTALDIDIVACTHLHMDHIGWNTTLEENVWVPTFPNARYLFIREEYEYWKNNPKDQSLDEKAAFNDSVSPIVEAGLCDLVNSNFAINDTIRFAPAPGHTLFHTSVVIESHQESAIISGDLLYHPCQIARPDWPTEGDPDSDEAYATRWKVLDELADTKALLIGSHFANPVAGRVSRFGDNFKLELHEA